MSSFTAVDRPGPVSAKLRRERLAAAFDFSLAGIVLAVWTVRIPSVKRAFGLGGAQVGVALPVVAAGGLMAM